MDSYSYVEVLREEFRGRQTKNETYSLRAFAKALKISHAHLSQVLRKKKRLSLNEAIRIGALLQWDEQRQRLFFLMVEYCWVRSRSEKERVAKELKAHSKAVAQKAYEVPAAHALKINSWHHFALLELSEIETFCPDPSWIAKKLEISATDVKKIIESLEIAGLLSVSDGFKKVHTNYTVGRVWTEEQKHARDKAHAFHLNQASKSLQSDSLSERDFSSVTMAFQKEKLPDAKKLIAEFRKSLLQLGERCSTKNSVFQLNVQFFEILGD